MSFEREPWSNEIKRQEQPVTPERRDCTAGRAEIKVFETPEECLRSRYGQEIHREMVDAHQYEKRLKRLGLEAQNVKVEKIKVKDEREERSFFAIESHYTPDVKMTQIFTEESFAEDRNFFKLNELMFTAENTNKSAAIRNALPEECSVFIDSSWFDGHFVRYDRKTITLFPLGREIKIPPFQKWRASKKMEPLILWHEIGHIRQNYNLSDLNNIVKAERDASRYAIQMVRELKRQGINLMPEIDNEEIVRQVERSLLTYDIFTPQQLVRRFSSRLNRLAKNDTSQADEWWWKPLHYAKHFYKVTKALFSTIGKQF